MGAAAGSRLKAGGRSRFKPKPQAEEQAINNDTDNRVPDSTIAIADIAFRLRAASANDAFEIDPTYRPFVRAARRLADRRPDVELTVHYGETTPEIGGAEDVFDSGGNWQLKRRGGRYFMPLSSPVFEPELYKLLMIDEELARGDIYVTEGSPSGHNSRSNPARRYPLQYPLDEVLMINLLSRQRGVEIHGLGVEYEGHGLLFTGTSGAGKSTTASLWKQRPGVNILSDDRLIVRRPDGTGDDMVSGDKRFRLFGTPWHGDAGVCSYGGVNLDRIMVLRQAPANRLVKLSAAEAATALMVRCFPTFWDAKGMDYTLRILGEICAEVPCFELQFKPEPAALDMVIDSLKTLI